MGRQRLWTKTQSLGGRWGPEIKVEVYVDLLEQNVQNNTSTIEYFVYLRSSSEGAIYNVPDGWIQVWFDRNKDLDFKSNAYIQKNQRILKISQTRTINHNADGNKSIFMEFIVEPNVSPYYTLANVNGTVNFPKISRPSDFSWSGDFEIGKGKQVTIERKQPNTSHVLKWHFVNKTGQVSFGSSTSQGVVLPMELMTQIPNASSSTGTFTLETYLNGSKIGETSKGFTALANTSSKPSLSSVTVSESTPSLNGVMPVNHFVQTLSNVRVAFGSASGTYGSTISSYRAEVVGRNNSLSEAGVLQPFQFNGQATIRAYVIDSRGIQSEPKEVTVTVHPYTPPAISATVERVGTNKDTLQVRRTIQVAPLTVNGSQKNTMRLRAYTRPSHSTNWTENTGPATGTWTSQHSLTNSNANLAGNFPGSASYEVKLVLSDRFTSSERVIDVPTEAVIESITRQGIGIMKVRERGALDIKGDTYVDGMIYRNNKEIQTYPLTFSNGMVGKNEKNAWEANGTFFEWRSADRPEKPIDDWGLLRQYHLDTKKAVQFFTAINSARTFVRVSNNPNRWDYKPWKELAFKEPVIESSFAGPHGSHVLLARQGNVVTLTVNSWTTDINDGFEHRKMNEKIPNGFKPAIEVVMNMAVNNYSNVFPGMIWHIYKDGAIHMTNMKRGYNKYSGTITYITNDPYP